MEKPDKTGSYIAKIFCQSIHPNRNLVATGSLDSTVRIWSIRPVDPHPGFPRVSATTKPGLIVGVGFLIPIGLFLRAFCVKVHGKSTSPSQKAKNN